MLLLEVAAADDDVEEEDPQDDDEDAVVDGITEGDAKEEAEVQTGAGAIAGCTWSSSRC